MISSLKNAPGARPFLELFVIDIRSLAVLRIGLALVSLFYLFSLFPDVEMFLSNEGLLPIELSQQLSPATLNGEWSLYWFNGSTSYAKLLITVHAIAACLLLIGLQTRIMTVVCLVLTWSLLTRNPLIVDSGQHLLKMMLLWSVFLPLGAAWSLDAKISRRPRSRINWNIVNIATVTIMGQVLVGYFIFSVSLVLNQVNLVDLFAVVGQPNSLVNRMVDGPESWIPISRVLCLISFLGPLSLFIPRFSEFFRGFWLSVHWMFHMGIWLTLETGCYPWMAIVSTFVFIPSSFWNLQYEPRYFRDESSNHFLRQKTLANDCRLYFCSFLVIVVLLASAVQWNLIDLGSVGNDRVMYLSQMTMTAPERNALPQRPATETGGTIRPSFKYAGELTNGQQVDLLSEFESANAKLAKRSNLLFPGARWSRFHLLLWKLSSPGNARNEVADRLLDWAIFEWQTNAPNRASRLKTARLECYEQLLVNGEAQHPAIVTTWSEQKLKTRNIRESSANGQRFLQLDAKPNANQGSGFY